MLSDFQSAGPFGRIAEESDDVYHANRSISKSKLCDFIDGGAAFFHQKHIARTVPDEDTPAKLDGRLFHSLMGFGIGRFDQDHPVVPDFGDCRLKANKEQRDAWRAEHPGWEESAVTPEKRQMFMAMHSSVQTHRAARDLVNADGREMEVSWRYKSPNLPFAVQCRPDLLNMTGCRTSQRRPYIVDFKSIANLSRGKDPAWLWEKELTERRYYIQDPFYTSVLDLCGVPVDDIEFYFVVTEKNPPFATGVWTLDEIARGTGRRVIREKTAELAECFVSNVWRPNTSDEVQTSTIPEWRLQKDFKPTTYHE